MLRIQDFHTFSARSKWNIEISERISVLAYFLKLEYSNLFRDPTLDIWKYLIIKSRNWSFSKRWNDQTQNVESFCFAKNNPKGLTNRSTYDAIEIKKRGSKNNED